MPKILRPSAASRIAIWTTLAFALGTALAFSILYILVSRNIRERGDAWLSGEAGVLAHVALDTPQDRLYKRVLGEVAELATHELPDERNSRGQNLNSVFFLEEYPNANQPRLWVGPGSVDEFLGAIRESQALPLLQALSCTSDLAEYPKRRGQELPLRR